MLPRTFFLRALPWSSVSGLLAAALLALPLAAQQPNASWWTRYEERVTATQNEQPHWVTPLVTVTPRLEQEVRTDFVRQTNTKLQNTWNYGNSKGLEIIPFRRVELLFNLPPFFNHDSNAKDGFGDVSFNSKYRIFSRNEESGNSIITAFLAATVPTGKNGNGSCCAVVTPTLAVGKGFGQLALTSTAGGSLPVTNSTGLGHTIAWNNTIQYRAAKTGPARLFWPELEFNSSFYKGGANDGKTATFATPGLILGRIPLTRDASGKPGRLGLTFGAGDQIALTHFHTYNHAIVLTARIPF
ncbi:MAG TPA: hypothetical protein VNW54_10815 [Granulicella sp.]|jgi:hypothetical protein|nr:hypothetical protein [Granulicella sp.]